LLNLRANFVGKWTAVCLRFPKNRNNHGNEREFGLGVCDGWVVAVGCLSGGSTWVAAGKSTKYFEFREKIDRACGQKWGFRILKKYLLISERFVEFMGEF